MAKPFEELIPEQMQLNGFLTLPLALEHVNAMMTLPWHHRDPFDRLLIAQAKHEGMSLISKDRYFDAYGVELVWD